MPANTTPIFPIIPKISFAKLNTANTLKDGTGAVGSVFTAGVNGSRVDYLKVKALGTNVATVLRVFINNGNSPPIATNNALFVEQTIDATTLSETSSLTDNVITLDLSLPAGYILNCTIGTSVSAGLMVTAVGGDY